VNWGSAAVHLERGERIAQLVVAPVTRAEIVFADALGESGRGDGGFGSTGR
jgi:dUTP pyrophosphatase